MGARKIFFIAVIVVMAAFAIFVRAGIDRTPPEPQAGPAVSHSPRGTYANCLTCHANVRETHARFGNFENCQDCHAYPDATPHEVEGTFANCMQCHADIEEGHDQMFEEYDNCLTCHEQAS